MKESSKSDANDRGQLDNIRDRVGPATLLKFNSSPLKSYLPNRKVVFQPSVFKSYGYVKLQGCTSIFFLGIDIKSVRCGNFIKSPSDTEVAAW